MNLSQAATKFTGMSSAKGGKGGPAKVLTHNPEPSGHFGSAAKPGPLLGGVTSATFSVIDTKP